MTVFVTGATGFVGRRFLPRLLTRLGPADRVYSLERRPEKPGDARVRPLAGDLRNLAPHAAALLESQWIYHLAADATFGAGARYHEINLEPVQRLLEILRESAALQCIVFVSTIGVLDRAPGDRVDAVLTPASTPHPVSDYGRSKLAAEACGRASGLPFIIIRPAWVYGAGMRANSHLNVLAALIARRPWMARFAWPGRVPLIHADDLAHALVHCLDQDAARGRTYIAVTENRALGDITAQLHRALHRRDVAPRLPWPRLRPLMRWFHSRLPLSLNNLFLDYLAADDPDFRRDLLPGSPVPLVTGITELAAEHSRNGRSWVVTGANSGIGLALVQQLLVEGCHVVAVDRAIDRLTPNASLAVVAADLTDRRAVEELTEKILHKARRITVLINNAGVGFRGGLFDQDWARTEQTINVNIRGTLHLTHLLKTRLVRDGTTIVNIASSVAYHPLPGMSVYAASKAFIRSWSLALGEELRSTNRVVTFSPSGTRTNFQANGEVRNVTCASLLDPAQVAAAIITAARRGHRHHLMGLRSHITIFVAGLLPLGLRLTVLHRAFRATR